MIVVAIIDLRSSVAMPLFGRDLLREKSAEAVANLGAIRVVREADISEHGACLPANAEPPLIPGRMSTDPRSVLDLHDPMSGDGPDDFQRLSDRIGTIVYLIERLCTHGARRH